MLETIMKVNVILQNSRKSIRTPKFLTKITTEYSKLLKTKVAPNDQEHVRNHHLSFFIGAKYIENSSKWTLFMSSVVEESLRSMTYLVHPQSN